MRILTLTFAALCALASSLASASTLYTYNFTIGDFANETVVPPATPPSVTEWTGSVTLDMDLTSLVGEFGFVDAITPFSNDVPFEFNSTNSVFSKITQVAVPTPLFRVYVGGLGLSATPNLAEAGGLTGGTNDYRFGFEVDNTGAVQNVLVGEQLGATYNNSTPSAFVARMVEIELATNDAMAVPLPPSSFLLLGALGAFVANRRLRRT